MDEIKESNLTSLPLLENLPGADNTVETPNGRCRLCVSRGGKMVPIFSEEGKEMDLAYKINKLLPTMVTPMDRLPQEVCYECISNLNTAFEFVKKCMQSQARLRRILNKCIVGNKLRIKVIQDCSALLSLGDSIENRTEHQMRRSIDPNQTKEETIGETESDGKVQPKWGYTTYLKKLKLINDSHSHRKILSSNVLDSKHVHENEVELPSSSLEVADNGDTGDNDSASENNTTETKELTVTTSENNPAEKYILDESSLATEVKHICKFCEKGFLWKADLFDHQTAMHSDLVIRCGYCLKVFYDKSELKSHVLAHIKLFSLGEKVKKQVHFHSHKCKKSEYFIKSSLGPGFMPKNAESDFINLHDKSESDKICYYCNIAFTSVKMQRNHLRREHKLRFPCRFCPITCSSIYELLKHEGRHKEKANKHLICKKCRKILYYFDDLRHHRLIHIHKDGFKCEICGEEFMNEVIYEEHIKLHGSESSYLCEACGQSSESFFVFRVHKLSHMYPDLQRCELCDSCFHSVAELDNHLEEIHKRKKIHCSICDEGFISMELLKEHKAMHDNPEYKCNSCGKIFNTVKKLRIHTQIHSSEHNYLCEKCGRGFKLKSGLQSHRQVCQVVVSCNVCSRKFNGTSRLMTHMRLHTGVRSHLCSVCGKGFHVAWALNQHMLIHNPKVPCPLCGLRFIKKAYMLTHMKRHIVSCDTCGQVFANTPLLLAHQKIHVENGERPADEPPSKIYKCDDCGMPFVTALDLKNHKPIHSDERPYKCNICGKSYRRMKDLGKHTAASHSGPKPYQCRYCPCGFITQQKLSIHENGHIAGKPYVCEVCGFGFWSPLSLEKHVIKHATIATEKHYSCNNCNKSFHHKSSLIMHRQTHLAHQTHGCPFCFRKFASLRFMKRHKCALDPNRQGNFSSSQSGPIPSLPVLIEETPTVESECTVLQHVQPEIQGGGGPLPSLPTLTEEAPTLLSECSVPQQVQPEIQGGDGDNKSTESVDFVKHLKLLVKGYEATAQILKTQDKDDDAEGSGSSIGRERLDEEEEISEPMHPHLQHSESSKNVRLVSQIPVYIRRSMLDKLSCSKLSSTNLARKLLEEVFTQDALLQCSVKGQRPNSSSNLKKRESLFSSGIQAILSFVHQVDQCQGRPPIKNSDLVSAMGHRLNELRKLHLSVSLEELVREAAGEEQL